MTARSSIALLLDFDGTLVPTAPTPDAVTVTDGLRRLVAAAAERLDGRLAIVSGRSLQQLDVLWGRALWPLTVAASHGLELHHDGHRCSPPEARIFARLARETDARFGLRCGVVTELKSFGLGLHYRLSPHLRSLVKHWAEECANEHGLVIQEGELVFELRLPGADKGDAVRAIMGLAPFAGSIPVYVGDDFTDIPAIKAARALGGRGLAVGERVAAHADGVLAEPAAVHQGIRALVEGQPGVFIT